MSKERGHKEATGSHQQHVTHQKKSTKEKSGSATRQENKSRMLTMNHRSRGAESEKGLWSTEWQGQGGREWAHTQESQGTQKGRESAFIWLGSHTIRGVQRNHPVRWRQVKELSPWLLSSVSRQWDNSVCFLVTDRTAQSKPQTTGILWATSQRQMGYCSYICKATPFWG